MSTHYETLHPADTYREAFGVEPPAELGERHLWPRKPGAFIVHAATAAAIADPAAAANAEAEQQAQAQSPTNAEGEATQPTADDHQAEGNAATTRVLVPAQWGLVPHWVKSASDAKLRAPKLVNAKSDLASTGTAFRDAWLKGQRCIVPMQAFYEDDYRAGKALPTRISRVDGKPMGVAGLWARWQGSDGEVIVSYCLLTVNANNHALLHRYQQPGSEKSMPAILNEGAYDAWLTARQDKAKEFMRQYAPQWLTANPVEKKADKVPKGLLG
ncbi:SOS response-associated peptidase [Acidovorax sp. LjRoot194]|uniref:SOS response-associated peptidase n=1 Tax=Acidovorax sp. LjRoot194 TaxID=3342280 RepID=UPI003ECFFBE4